MGNVEQDFSVVHPSGCSGFGSFAILAFSDCDLISQKLCKIMPVGNQCLFPGHFQMEFFADKTAYVLFHLFCVLLTADNTYQKIIRVPDIANLLIAVVHLVTVRYRFQTAPQFPDFRD